MSLRTRVGSGSAPGASPGDLESHLEAGQSGARVVDHAPAQRLRGAELEAQGGGTAGRARLDRARRGRRRAAEHRPHRVSPLPEAVEREAPLRARDGLPNRTSVVGGQEHAGPRDRCSRRLDPADDGAPLPFHHHDVTVAGRRHGRLVGGRETGGLDQHAVRGVGQTLDPKMTIQIRRCLDRPESVREREDQHARLGHRMSRAGRPPARR